MRDDEYFEAIYRSADRDRDRLGWNRPGPNPILTSWLEGESRVSGRAMVVACGVGDDAEYLASRGWDVTAFDISPTAIAWCRERFPDSPVDYQVANLFDLPQEWRGTFDLAVEVFTIQSIPPHQASRAIESIAALVAVRGTLLVSSLTSDGTEPRNGPPWPVDPVALDGFVTAGLVELGKAEQATPYPSVGKLEIEYTRP